MYSNVYRLQPDENGEGGETWRAFANDQSMQLNEAERTIATLAAERANFEQQLAQAQSTIIAWENSLGVEMERTNKAEAERAVLVTEGAESQRYAEQMDALAEQRLTSLEAALSERDALKQQLAALVTALEEFGTHKFSCNTYKKPEAPGLCTCGLEAAFIAYTVSALAAVRVDPAVTASEARQQATTKA